MVNSALHDSEMQMMISPRYVVGLGAIPNGKIRKRSHQNKSGSLHLRNTLTQWKCLSFLRRCCFVLFANPAKDFGDSSNGFRFNFKFEANLPRVWIPFFYSHRSTALFTFPNSGMSVRVSYMMSSKQFDSNWCGKSFSDAWNKKKTTLIILCSRYEET